MVYCADATIWNFFYTNLANFNFQPPISVKQQQDPNPDFPTVVFPNPEELQCLELSKQLAEEKGVKLVLVNDPDADRLAVAEFDDTWVTWVAVLDRMPKGPALPDKWYLYKL